MVQMPTRCCYVLILQKDNSFHAFEFHSSGLLVSRCFFYAKIYFLNFQKVLKITYLCVDEKGKITNYHTPKFLRQLAEAEGVKT